MKQSFRKMKQKNETTEISKTNKRTENKEGQEVSEKISFGGTCQEKKR